MAVPNGGRSRRLPHDRCPLLTERPAATPGMTHASRNYEISSEAWRDQIRAGHPDYFRAIGAARRSADGRRRAWLFRRTGHWAAALSGFFANFRPIRAERHFRTGDLVRWLPPDGAYSPHSAQARHARESGLVVSVDGDLIYITFGDGYPVACNAAYLSRLRENINSLLAEIKPNVRTIT